LRRGAKRKSDWGDERPDFLTVVVVAKEVVFMEKRGEGIVSFMDLGSSQ
jgi:hypothetical protein